MNSRAALLTACLLFAGAASAQEAPMPDLDTGEPAASGTRWTLGLGAVAFPDYQGSFSWTVRRWPWSPPATMKMAGPA